MSASNAVTRNIIMRNVPEGPHRKIWNYLLDNQMRYPRNVFIPPFKRPVRADKRRNIAVAEFEAMESITLGFPQPFRLRIITREWRREVDLYGTDDDIETIRSVLFSFRTRGYLIIFRFGNTRDLRIFATRYAAGLVDIGFSIQPINAGSELIAIKVRKNNHTWNLIDYEKSAGIQAPNETSTCQSTNDVRCACFKCLEQALDVLHTIQNFLVAKFRVSLKVTIGSASIRAAALTLPRALWKWKPHPLLVTMCRLGGAYRGGLIFGRGYRGPAWMVDTNRLYTWAITRKLPQSAALSQPTNDGVLCDGIYVCTVSGTASFPIYLSVWGNNPGGFTMQYWRGGTCHTILPSSEIEGIRSLGYRVEIGFGFRFIQTFNLATYVEKLLAVVGKYGTNHPFSRITKLMGNSVYGKFGERPERVDCIFSRDRPTADSFPFLSSDGTEIDNLWERKHVRYNAHQHVDIAAIVTGYGRRHMYESIAAIRASGGIIAATNTDSIITNIDPRPILQMDSNKIGKWREVAFDSDGITVARNAWCVGEQIALAGAPKHSRSTIELLARGEQVILHGIQKGHLLPGGPISREYSFTYGANSNIVDPHPTPKLSDQECLRMATFSDVPPLESLQQLAMPQETLPPMAHLPKSLAFAEAR